MDDTYKRKKRAESNLLGSFMDRQETFFEISRCLKSLVEFKRNFWSKFASNIKKRNLKG